MKLLLTMTLTCLIVSCGNSTEFKEDPFPGFQGQFPVESLNFASIKNSILKPHCIQCHGNYESYESVFNDREEILSAVLQGRMPKNAAALEDELKGLLQGWVRAGAPLGQSEEEPEVGLEATWESLNREVFAGKCVLCHNPDGQASFLDLSTRQSFFDKREELLNNFENVEESYLIEVITDPDEPMPPSWSGLDRLSEDEVKTIIEWIEKGLP
jgi:mono/diheme cytochrome c family protein